MIQEETVNNLTNEFPEIEGPTITLGDLSKIIENAVLTEKAIIRHLKKEFRKSVSTFSSSQIFQKIYDFFPNAEITREKDIMPNSVFYIVHIELTNKSVETLIFNFTK